MGVYQKLVAGSRWKKNWWLGRGGLVAPKIYFGLNAQTLRDPFPTPVVADLIAQTRGVKMFSKLDLQSGFHQMRIRKSDQYKTAFYTPSWLYEWVTLSLIHI